MLENRREYPRLSTNYPVSIKVDPLITIEGRITDLSVKGAYIEMRSGVYMEIHDEFKFLINCDGLDEDQGISGTACITRINKGKGIAVYFKEMDKASSAKLIELIKSQQLSI